MATKTERKFKKNELVKKILLASAGIAGVAALLAIAAIAPNSLQMLSLFKIGDKRKVRKSVKKMADRKLIEIYEKDGEETVKITEKGRKKLLKFKFDEIKINRQKKWDGLWRIVAFDIPDKRKVARDAFRKKLREMGFLKLQHSVFISPFPCENELDFVAEFFNIRKHINFIEANKIGDEYKIKHYFDIQ